MRKKNGFIATTLIYSFLLLFATLIVVIIGNYSYYRNTLHTYNKGINKALNSLIDSKYVTLTNLVSNSDFELNDSWVIRNSGSSLGVAGYSNDGSMGVNNRTMRFSGSGDVSATSNSFKCEIGHYYYVSWQIFTTGIINEKTNWFFWNTKHKYIGLYMSSSEDSYFLGRSINMGFQNVTRQGVVGVATTTSSTCNFSVYYNNTNDTVMHIDNVVVTDVTEVLSKANNLDTTKLANIFNASSTSGNIPYFHDTYIYSIDELTSNLN